MQSSDEINERRRHPRVSMDLPLEYRFPDAPHSHGALVVNASESGLLIHSVRDLSIGKKLNISVLFPKGFELSNFEVLAEIVWKDNHWEVNWEGYDFGIKFIHILEEEHQKLKQLLNNGHDG